jgi:hypothetical protein
MRWALPDRVFFACGACHILAHAFLERWGAARMQPVDQARLRAYLDRFSGPPGLLAFSRLGDKLVTANHHLTGRTGTL